MTEIQAGRQRDRETERHLDKELDRQRDSTTEKQQPCKTEERDNLRSKNEMTFTPAVQFSMYSKRNTN